jgi:hypothetical protein
MSCFDTFTHRARKRLLNGVTERLSTECSTISSEQSSQAKPIQNKRNHKARNGHALKLYPDLYPDNPCTGGAPGVHWSYQQGEWPLGTEGKIMDLYGKTIRQMQAAAGKVDRSWDDVKEGYRVVASDGSVLLEFTVAKSRADRLAWKHAGSVVVEVTR